MKAPAATIYELFGDTTTDDDDDDDNDDIDARDIEESSSRVDARHRCSSKEPAAAAGHAVKKRRTSYNDWPSKIGVCDGVLKREECEELIAVHESNCHQGYIDHLTVTRVSDLQECKHLSLMVVNARSKLWKMLEERVSETKGWLMPEFTALTAWHTGAVLNPHYDSNKEYLKDRHYSAILYLNDPTPKEQEGHHPSNYHGTGFEGGDLIFDIPAIAASSTNEKRIVPRAGRLVWFPSCGDYVHRVETVTRGTRYALTMWFTKNVDATEDLQSLFLTRPLNLPQPWETPKQARQLQYLKYARANLLGLFQNRDNDDSNDGGRFVSMSFGTHPKLPQLSETEWNHWMAYCWWKKGIPLGDCLDGQSNPPSWKALYDDWKQYVASRQKGLASALERWRKNGMLVTGVRDEELTLL